MIGAVVVALTATLAMSACGGNDNPLSEPTTSANASSGAPPGGQTVVVGSFNFHERELLGSIYAQALSAKGVQVEEKPNIGSREVVYDQIKSGGLTVLPEYNGALLAYLDSSAAAVTKDEVNAALTSKLPPELVILDSAAAEDKDTMSVTEASASKYGLKSIADLSKVAKDFVVGGPPEFKKRREQQFKDVYGLTFKGWKSTGDTTADAIKSDAVQVGNVFSTDPKILLNGLVPLDDPKNLFAAQNVTPLVNKAGVNDTVKSTLNAVSAKLDTAGLVALMKRIAVDKDDPPAVAKDWLTQNGLI
jgi:osmoprotectant transport system substrate-binding protein